MLKSERYATFLGWLVNIKSMTRLYKYIVEEDHLKYLCTFKLSQDPLENFFSSIRMSCGFGNNPTSIQFKSAFQNMLCKTVNKSDHGNSLFDETVNVIDLSTVDCDFDFGKSSTNLGVIWDHLVVIWDPLVVICEHLGVI